MLVVCRPKLISGTASWWPDRNTVAANREEQVRSDDTGRTGGITISATPIAADAQGWAQRIVAGAHSTASRVGTVVPDAPVAPTVGPPPATQGTGYDRALLDGVTIDRPLSMVSTLLTNAAERMTGSRDERSGPALTQLLLAGQQFVQVGLRYAAQGNGIIATGSSLLGKVLPMVGIASGAWQIYKGWNELDNHDEGVMSLIHSKTARTGMMQVLAGGLLFVPGVGPALAGAVTRLAAAANEMDVFHSLDWSSTPLEQKDAALARKAHPLDRTPTNPYDRVRRRDAATVQTAALLPSA